MRNWIRPAVVIFVVSLTLTFIAEARAAYQDNPKLDQIATTLAGKSEQVACSSSWGEWNGWIGTSFAPGTTPEFIEGYNFLESPVLYLNPKICEVLTVMTLAGYADAGPYFAAEALTVLVHESEHQALNSSDEGLVECTALANVDTVLEQNFAVPTTVTSVSYKVTSKLVKGKRVYTITKVVKTAPNPWLLSFDSWVKAWHNVRPAQYHAGTCG